MYHIESRNIKLSNNINKNDYFLIKRELNEIFEICKNINISETILKYKIIIDVCTINNFSMYILYKITKYLKKNKNYFDKYIYGIELINVPKQIDIKFIHKFYKPFFKLNIKY